MWRRCCVVLALLISPIVKGQRAEENVVKDAQDAFGLTIGTESIGLYSSTQARGFSPKDAGNLVIDGFYYDQQTAQPSRRIIERSTLRVGLAAQSYPFAAPTGIVDYQLRLPGDSAVTSVALGVGPFDQALAEVDVQLPLSSTLSFGGGVSAEWNASRLVAQSSRTPSVGAILKWQPFSNLMLTPFAAWSAHDERGERPQVYLAGAQLPPRFEQSKLDGQEWTRFHKHEQDLGILANLKASALWDVGLGLFHSRRRRYDTFNESYYDASADGSATYVIAALPPQEFVATSGELRLSRESSTDKLRRKLLFALRGRDEERLFGGDDEHVLGVTQIGQPLLSPAEAFTPHAPKRLDVRQVNAGIHYAVAWKHGSELSAGVQMTRFARTAFDPVAGLSTRSRDRALLYNGTVAKRLSKRTTAYGSYSRGLEESGVAPENAVNKREVTPAIRSTQIDAGIRYALSDRASLVAGAFSIKKPYYGLNADRLYTSLGTVRHQGVEASLAGEFLDHLNVVAGIVRLRPRISADATAVGFIGKVPVGPTPLTASLSAEFAPPYWRGFSIDASIGRNGEKVASQDNQLKVSGSTELGLGSRYRFTMAGIRSTLRFRVLNLTNDRTWWVDPSGLAHLTDGRTIMLTLTSDI